MWVIDAIIHSFVATLNYFQEVKLILIMYLFNPLYLKYHHFNMQLV